jgi:hypothetical protein
VKEKISQTIAGCGVEGCFIITHATGKAFQKYEKI